MDPRLSRGDPCHLHFYSLLLRCLVAGMDVLRNGRGTTKTGPRKAKIGQDGAKMGPRWGQDGSKMEPRWARQKVFGRIDTGLIRIDTEFNCMMDPA